MKEFYSPSKKGFYSETWKDKYIENDNWPDDLIEISLEYKEDLLEKQGSGYSIEVDDKGSPIAVKWLCEETEVINKKLHESKLKADEIIQPMMGYAYSGILSEDEKKLFIKWNKYRKELDEIDITSSKIVWPKSPDEESK